jgi:hypothetical protein
MSDALTSDITSAIEMRVLTPENCKIFKGIYSLLHVQIIDDPNGVGLYRAIHAVRAFPISSPTEYISLRYPDEHGIEHEIGVIVDLTIFPPDTQELVQESLARYYFEYYVTRIYNVEWKYNLLFFDVETTEGRREFQMRWQVDRAHDYGEHSKVLLDVFDNRYLIPDLRDLPRADRERLNRYIYW